MLKSIPVMIVVVASITTSVVAQSQNQSRNPAEALSRLAQDECTFHIETLLLNVFEVFAV